MYIKQYKQFNFEIISKKFYPISPIFQHDISFLSSFLVSNFRYILDEYQSLNIFISKLDHVNGMGWNDDEIVIDQQNNLVYIGIVPDFCCDEEYDDIYEEKIKGKSLLQLYQENILEHLVISKAQFIYILTTWKKYLEEKKPFLLLYQDENDWFDILPFQSKEEMDQFIKKHTPIAN